MDSWGYKIWVIIMSAVVIVVTLLLACFGLPIYARQADEQSDTGMSVADGGIENGTDNADGKTWVVVVDSGHGGIDPGKTSLDGLLEKDINLSIAKKLKVLLEEQNIKVVMTREDDSGLYQESDNNKKVADMKKRCEIALQANADIVISIHQNSYLSADVSGAQMFYYKHSSEGKKLAEILQASFKEFVDANNTRVPKDNNTYYMLVHTKPVTVIAECGFLSNPKEAALLNTEEYQEKVALALCKGIIRYFYD